VRAAAIRPSMSSSLISLAIKIGRKSLTVVADDGSCIKRSTNRRSEYHERLPTDARLGERID
jgi:hypothetical protein